MSTSTRRRRPRRDAKKAPLSLDELLEREQETEQRLKRLRMAIAGRLRAEREALGLLIKDVHRASGISMSDLSLVERGLAFRPHQIRRAADALRAITAAAKAGEDFPVAPSTRVAS
jgi:hypothetical protein